VEGKRGERKKESGRLRWLMSRVLLGHRQGIRRIMTDLATLATISDNLKYVQERITHAAGQRTPELHDAFPSPRLVAVSKTKPKEAIIHAYQAGQRHFGENYVQELVEKATDSELNEICPDLKFHFIGHLQKNKVPKILAIVDKLYVLETVDSEALAKSLNDGLERRGLDGGRLNVMVQINTSGEDSKSGADPKDCVPLVKYVIKSCPRLEFIGLMTIGAFDPNPTDPHKDFNDLLKLRNEVCGELGLNIKNVELSMGMSGDYEDAVRLGSSNIRVGSTIFGARQKAMK